MSYPYCRSQLGLTAYGLCLSVGKLSRQVSRSSSRGKFRKKIVSKKLAARTVIEEELTKVNGAVPATDKLAAKLAESDKAFEAASMQVDSFKEEMVKGIRRRWTRKRTLLKFVRR